MKKNNKQSDINRDFINVLILLILASSIGIYLIATTAIIAKDGVTFIKYGQRLATDPLKTIENEFQHPGYPWLIFIAHKATYFLHKNTSILSWIYCAQSVTLIFRLLAIAILYFIGKHLLGARTSFWAITILIFLPKAAEYGSDALSDWPHLFFVVTGVLLLFNGAFNKRWWIFGFAGLASGAGYLIRPECAQLVVLGILWLLLQLLLPKRTMNFNRTFLALSLLMAGFIVIAGPYMCLKGAIFPKKNVGQFTRSPEKLKGNTENKQTVSKTAHIPLFTPLNIAKAFGKLFENIGETLMWFFVPFMLIGMYHWFMTRKWTGPETFFIITLIILNVPVMIWLYCKYGYMSDRHTLPMLILPILYVPAGLQRSAIWLQERFSKRAAPSDAINRNERFWFLVLLIAGVSICAPKLLRPIRFKEQGFRAAAIWLRNNTKAEDIIAVPDKRISFYAERKELVYENEKIPNNADYIVKISGKQNGNLPPRSTLGKLEYEYVDKEKTNNNIGVYRKLERDG